MDSGHVWGNITATILYYCSQQHSYSFNPTFRAVGGPERQEQGLKGLSQNRKRKEKGCD